MADVAQFSTILKNLMVSNNEDRKNAEVRTWSIKSRIIYQDLFLLQSKYESIKFIMKT